ncbi:hypothetical protein CWB41_08700 [Methylovirgula ligni]|uniref:Copper(I)-binding protein n=1 Tax=Methylovirgula ligni TaxID=569860 RepID=A0A3D9Z5K0_9HYPH|nr:copper chaperone PCu(A)C [Methylovirgula ligni]QAY95803.1 hypothetical protein CWB41_08700 [Methylovirgula ligni]REF88809.1 copper(I)-binding protein [Methylovirgula ligni]
MKSHLFGCAFAALCAVPAFANPVLEMPSAMPIVLAAEQSTAAGTLTIEGAFTRPTPGGATVAVGYVTIVNTGKTDDRLVAVTSDLSAGAQIHETKMENGIMEMTELPDGLVIPAGATVAIKPGGYHIMFTDLKRAVKPGDAIHAVLEFAKAGKIAVTFVAASSMGATAPDAMKMDGGMNGMKMH